MGEAIVIYTTYKIAVSKSISTINGKNYQCLVYNNSAINVWIDLQIIIRPKHNIRCFHALFYYLPKDSVYVYSGFGRYWSTMKVQRDFGASILLG
jgi:hypothetical protein